MHVLIHLWLQFCEKVFEFVNRLSFEFTHLALVETDGCTFRYFRIILMHVLIHSLLLMIYVQFWKKILYSILFNFVNCYSFDYSPLAKVETAWTNAHSGSFKLFSCVF